MHELGIAENILDIVLHSIPESRASAVGTIRLRVGQLAGIVPDSLKFCFDVISGDAGMSNASLNIEMIPLAASCRDCGNESEVGNFGFLCPTCGGGNLEIVSGKELEIIDIEIL